MVRTKEQDLNRYHSTQKKPARSIFVAVNILKIRLFAMVGTKVCNECFLLNY